MSIRASWYRMCNDMRLSGNVSKPCLRDGRESGGIRFDWTCLLGGMNAKSGLRQPFFEDVDCKVENTNLHRARKGIRFRNGNFAG